MRSALYGQTRNPAQSWLIKAPSKKSPIFGCISWLPFYRFLRFLAGFLAPFGDGAGVASIFRRPASKLNPLADMAIAFGIKFSFTLTHFSYFLVMATGKTHEHKAQTFPIIHIFISSERSTAFDAGR